VYKCGIFIKWGAKMNFLNKQDLVNYIKQQFNVDIKNEKHHLNDNPNILYAEIPIKHKNSVVGELKRRGVRIEEHINNKYWIWLINKED
jgi:hypothetical protein